MGKIALVGTFDTKGTEFLYVKDTLEKLNNQVITINVGVFESSFPPDIDSDELAKIEDLTMEDIRSNYTRGEANSILGHALTVLLPRLYEQGKFDGVLSLGGSGGTSLVTPAMQKLPIGVPKIVVSTVASGNTAMYVGTSDIMMMPSIVDVAGLNKISETIFDNAAAAISGMVNSSIKADVKKQPLIGMTMFGVTTKAVDNAQKLLEDKGYTGLVFHATGTGGKTMESLVNQDYFKGVIDFTTTELADELVGGVLTAGPNRLNAAVEKNIPQVVVPGALDMVNFGPVDTVPSKFKDRKFLKHNPTVTLMRTTVEENQELGKIVATKLNKTKAPLTMMIPTNGFSEIGGPDMPFRDRKADQAFIDSFKENVNNNLIEIKEIPNNINDADFSKACVNELMRLIK